MRLGRTVPGVLLAAAVALPASHVSAADTEHGSDTRLVLQITVDQLRGDMPSRWPDRMAEGR